MIANYNSFVDTLLNAGFSMGGGNSEGIYAIINWGWNETPLYETPIVWHTGDPDTDPWEWRMRVLEERDDIAYGKFFFKKSGFITREWYPYFLAARRSGSFQDMYESGMISHDAKRVYDIIAQNDATPSHIVKQAAGFTKESKAAFDRALVELQMLMFITVCGRQVTLTKKGTVDHMPSSMFCTTESFFGDDVFQQAAQISTGDAIEKITGQVLKLNPDAQAKKVVKFIRG